MIKRTLLFSNPAYLSTKNKQLLISFPEKGKDDLTVPIEDIGLLMLESPQITLTNKLIELLVSNNVAIVTCDKQHMPCALLQPLSGHSVQSERFRYQLNASVPLKKNIWQQTITSKIVNQAHHLRKRKQDYKTLLRWASEVKSGDSTQVEGAAAAYYFQRIFSIDGYSRTLKGDPPNNLLNYGYAILRAITARALIGSGMLPSVAIYHVNKYNAFGLADDIMEPYRPFVDAMVYDIIQDENEDWSELSINIKSKLLKLPVLDVMIDGRKSPLLSAMSRTTNSLYECFAGIARKVLYPNFI